MVTLSWNVKKRSWALTCEVLDIVGFTIHPVKSVFKPSQTIEFLQFSNRHKPLNSYSFQTVTNHWISTVFKLSQAIEFLVFSLTLTTCWSLTSAKADKTRQACLSLFRKHLCSIRQLAEVIGQLLAAQPGFWTAPLSFKRLESVKDCALRAPHLPGFSGFH